jgi:hypothetical protein
MMESYHSFERRTRDRVHSLEREAAHRRLLTRLAAATLAGSDCCRGAPPAATRGA